MKRNKIKSYDVPFIEEAKRILETNPTRRLTHIDLSLEVGINESKLREGFKYLFNTTIHQYQVVLRLNIAKQLLNETDLTLAEIARRTGFDSREGFVRCFQRKYNQSPSNWREQLVTRQSLFGNAILEQG